MNNLCDIVQVLSSFQRIIDVQKNNSKNSATKEHFEKCLKIWNSYKYAKEIIVNHLINEFSLATTVLEGSAKNFSEPMLTNLMQCVDVLKFVSYECRREVLDFGIEQLKLLRTQYSEPYQKSFNLAINYLENYNGLYVK